MMDIPKNLESGGSVKAIGRSVYDKYCVACHGINLEGNGPSFPSLVDAKNNHGQEEFEKLVVDGRNMMPAFKQIPTEELRALTSYVLDLEEKEEVDYTNKTDKSPKLTSIRDSVPYVMTGYNRFLDKNGYPGITPPWGTLNAIDLVSGKLMWKVPLGEYPELNKKGIPKTGTENYGGPVVTKGGVVFIAATKDSKIRAFDKNSGEELWEANLPAPGYATPAVYEVEGKQYLVIACGGGKIGSISGDRYLAFSLP